MGEWLWRAARLTLVAVSGTALVDYGVSAKYAVPIGVFAGLALKVIGLVSASKVPNE
jgi:hypothetical protein